MIRASRYFVCVMIAALAVASRASIAPGQQATDPYKEALHYRFDQPRTAVVAIEAQIRAAKPEQLRVIESKLLEILGSQDATTDAKAWVCRQLRQAGSEHSVGALVPLLSDKDLATPARLALQSIRGRKLTRLFAACSARSTAISWRAWCRRSACAATARRSRLSPR